MNPRDLLRASQKLSLHNGAIARYCSDLSTWSGQVAKASDPVEAFRKAAFGPTVSDRAVQIECSRQRRQAEIKVFEALERHVEEVARDHPQIDDLLRLAKGWPDLRLKLLRTAVPLGAPQDGSSEEQRRDRVAETLGAPAWPPSRTDGPSLAPPADDGIDRLVAEFMAGLPEEEIASPAP